MNKCKSVKVIHHIKIIKDKKHNIILIDTGKDKIQQPFNKNSQ